MLLRIRKERLLRLTRFDKLEVSLRNRAPLKGAIAGVSWGYIPGVLDARRMNRVVNGKKINSLYGSYIIWSFSLQLGYTNYSQSEHLSQDQCSVIIVKLLDMFQVFAES